MYAQKRRNETVAVECRTARGKDARDVQAPVDASSFAPRCANHESGRLLRRLRSPDTHRILQRWPRVDSRRRTGRRAVTASSGADRAASGIVAGRNGRYHNRGDPSGSPSQGGRRLGDLAREHHDPPPPTNSHGTPRAPIARRTSLDAVLQIACQQDSDESSRSPFARAVTS